MYAIRSYYDIQESPLNTTDLVAYFPFDSSLSSHDNAHSFTNIPGVSIGGDYNGGYRGLALTFVITSYSIHYTKLYEPFGVSPLSVFQLEDVDDCRTAGSRAATSQSRGIREKSSQTLPQQTD